MKGDRVDHQFFIGDAIPKLASIIGAIKTTDRAGEECVAIAGADLDVVNAAIVESITISYPILTMIFRVIYPAARRHPHVVGIFRIEGDGKHVGVEDHAVVDQRPVFLVVFDSITLALYSDI